MFVCSSSSSVGGAFFYIFCAPKISSRTALQFLPGAIDVSVIITNAVFRTTQFTIIIIIIIIIN